MSHPESQRLAAAAHHLLTALKEQATPILFAGADGFVDEIIHVVDKRYDATRYDAVPTIASYAARLAQAAGKSTNVEFVVEQVKSGGNGPLLAEGFGRLGGRINYVGCIGWPTVDPLFSHLQAFGTLRTIAPVAQTLAAEFTDGKIMHGKHQVLKEVTWENLVARVGGVEVVDAMLAEATAVGLVNWTMLPYLTGIFEGILSRLGTLGERAPRLYFFDLCDPEKRTDDDLKAALSAIAKFSQFGQCILGLNEKESQEVCEAYGIEPGGADAHDLLARAERIALTTGIDEIVIHPTRRAVSWNKDSHGMVEGPFCPNPRLTTGAGDHFNSGYLFARSLGLSPADAVVIGKCVSGFYVRQGRGPSAAELEKFADLWAAGKLDPWQLLPGG